MSEPLTLDHFDRFEKKIDRRLDAIQEALASTETRLTKKIEEATIPHFTALRDDLGKITDRLDRIDHILWDGERVAEIERRLIALAETVGRPDLATPIPRPIGS